MKKRSQGIFQFKEVATCGVVKSDMKPWAYCLVMTLEVMTSKNEGMAFSWRYVWARHVVSWEEELKALLLDGNQLGHDMCCRDKLDRWHGIFLGNEFGHNILCREKLNQWHGFFFGYCSWSRWVMSWSIWVRPWKRSLGLEPRIWGHGIFLILVTTRDITRCSFGLGLGTILNFDN